MTAPHEQTEEALHEQREWLRVTLSSIGDAVITTDISGSVRVVLFQAPIDTPENWFRNRRKNVASERVFRAYKRGTTNVKSL